MNHSFAKGFSVIVAGRWNEGLDSEPACIIVSQICKSVIVYIRRKVVGYKALRLEINLYDNQ